jgi:predicted nucleotidyltransferase component of viral defense system
MAEAADTGFRPEVLERVFQLLSLLESLRSHPFLKGRLVLKGGTALNLFYFDVPRLSVDIDLNYIGAVDRETMLQERPQVEQAVQAGILARGDGRHETAGRPRRREVEIAVRQRCHRFRQPRS